MLPRFADIIIHISHEAIDRTFQYKIPEELQKAFDANGMDGVWAIADAEDVVDNGYKIC